jgi:hypothetical protein
LHRTLDGHVITHICIATNWTSLTADPASVWIIAHVGLVYFCLLTLRHITLQLNSLYQAT